jgi:hypothetical protein
MIFFIKINQNVCNEQIPVGSVRKKILNIFFSVGEKNRPSHPGTQGFKAEGCQHDDRLLPHWHQRKHQQSAQRLHAQSLLLQVSIPGRIFMSRWPTYCTY